MLKSLKMYLIQCDSSAKVILITQFKNVTVKKHS